MLIKQPALAKCDFLISSSEDDMLSQSRSIFVSRSRKYSK
uniref:Uncharacterized protein n=1 Tax=Arundo donax TaxID=35708 RepID=A0A0A9DFF5_ARUDO